MSNQKMGFEGKLLIGTAGSTAATAVTNCTDVNYNFDMDNGNTTVRGDGSAPPIETGDVTVRKFSIDWTMVNDTTDTALQTVLTAAYAGTALAVRTKDYTSGKGYDGDCIFKVDHGEPLNGEQTYKITATPSRAAGRTPQPYI